MSHGTLWVVQCVILNQTTGSPKSTIYKWYMAPFNASMCIHIITLSHDISLSLPPIPKCVSLSCYGPLGCHLCYISLFSNAFECTLNGPSAMIRTWVLSPSTMWLETMTICLIFHFLVLMQRMCHTFLPLVPQIFYVLKLFCEFQ